MRWLWMGVGLSVGCGADGPTNAEIFCAAECSRLRACDWRAVDWCSGGCESERTSLSRYRTQVVESVASCIRSIDCNDFFEDEPFLPCWQRAAEQTEPTEDTRAFCAEESLVQFECGYLYPTDVCETGRATLSAGFLSELARCHDRLSCDEFEQCQESVWE